MEACLVTVKIDAFKSRVHKFMTYPSVGCNIVQHFHASLCTF